MNRAFTCLLLIIIALGGLIGGCKAQDKQATNVPEEKVKQAYFAMITCQGEEARKNLQESEKYCLLGLKELEGYNHPLQEPLYASLIDIYFMKNKFLEAEKLQLKMITLTDLLHGKQSAQYANSIAAYGASMVRDARFNDAKHYVDDALPLLEKMSEQAKGMSGGLDWYQVTLRSAALIQVNEQHDNGALEILKKWEKYKGRIDRTEADYLLGLANIYAEVGETYYTIPNQDLNKARIFYEKSLILNSQASTQLPKVKENAKRYIKTDVVPPPAIVTGANHLASIYNKNGLTQKAAKLGCSLKMWNAYYKTHPPAQNY